MNLLNETDRKDLERNLLKSYVEACKNEDFKSNRNIEG